MVWQPGSSRSSVTKVCVVKLRDVMELEAVKKSLVVWVPHAAHVVSRMDATRGGANVI